LQLAETGQQLLYLTSLRPRAPDPKIPPGSKVRLERWAFKVNTSAMTCIRPEQVSGGTWML